MADFKKEFTILLIEDELVVAENIMHVLEQAGYEVCGIAQSADEAIDLFKQHAPHLLVCDIHIKGDRNGIELARSVSQVSSVPFLYLTALGDKASIDAALQTEPAAYLIKPFTEKQLLVTVQLALDRFYQDPAQVLPEKPSKREMEILQLIAEGKNSSEIAGHLFISVHTANTHRKNLMEKYGAKSSSELIALAAKNKWIR